MIEITNYCSLDMLKDIYIADLKKKNIYIKKANMESKDINEIFLLTERIESYKKIQISVLKKDIDVIKRAISNNKNINNYEELLKTKESLLNELKKENMDSYCIYECLKILDVKNIKGFIRPEEVMNMFIKENKNSLINTKELNSNNETKKDVNLVKENYKSKLDNICDNLFNEYILNGNVEVPNHIYEMLEQYDTTGEYSYKIAKNIPTANVELLENYVIDKEDYICNFALNVKNCNKDKLIKAFVKLAKKPEDIMYFAKVIDCENASDIFIGGLINNKNTSLKDLLEIAMIYNKPLPVLERYFNSIINKDNFIIAIEYFEKKEVLKEELIKFENNLINLNSIYPNDSILYNYIYYFSKINDINLVLSKLITYSVSTNKLSLFNLFDKINFSTLSSQTISLLENVIQDNIKEITANCNLLIQVLPKIIEYMPNINLEIIIRALLSKENEFHELINIYKLLISHNINLSKIVINKALKTNKVDDLVKLLKENLIEEELVISKILNICNEENINKIYSILIDKKNYNEELENMLIKFDNSGKLLHLYCLKYKPFNIKKIIEKLVKTNKHIELISVLKKYPFECSEDIELNILDNHKIDFSNLLEMYSSSLFTINKEKALGESIGSIKDLFRYIQLFGLENEISKKYVVEGINQFKLYSLNKFKENILAINKLSIKNKKGLILLIDNPSCIAEYILANKIYGNEDLFYRLLKIDNSGKQIFRLINQPDIDINEIIRSLIYRNREYLFMALEKPNVILPYDFAENMTVNEIYNLILNDKYSHLRSQLEKFLIEKDLSGKYLRLVFEKKISVNDKQLYKAIISKKNIKSLIFRTKYKKDYEVSDEIGTRDLDVEIINELLMCNDKLLATYKKIDLKMERLISFGHNTELLEKVKKSLIEGFISKKGLFNQEETISQILELLETVYEYIESLENQFYYRNKYINKQVDKTVVNEVQIIKNSFNLMTEETEKFTTSLK